MDFSGTLNWGDIVAQIVLHDVTLDDDGTITHAEVGFDVNGESTTFTIAPM